MVAPFEEVAFSMEIGEISLAQSEFGWHIIQVLGHEVRAIDPADFEQLQQQTFTDWLTTQRESAEIEIFDGQVEKVAPDEPNIPQAVLDQLVNIGGGQ